MQNVNLNKNIVFNTIKSLITVLFPIITFPYVSRVIGADNLGKISFSGSIISYVSLMATLGISPYAIRTCAKLRNDQAKFERTASQIYSINVYSTIFSYMVLIISLFIVAKLRDYRLLICVQSISVAFTTFGADWINTTFEDFKYLSIRTIIIHIFTLAALFIFVKSSDDYLIYVVISVVAGAGVNLFNVFYRRRFCRLRLTRKIELRKHLRPIMYMFSMTLTQTIFCNSDMTMLGIMKGDYQVGLYSVAVKFFSMLSNIISSNAWVTLPKTAENMEKGDWSEVNRLIKYSLNYIVIIGWPAIVGLNVIAQPLIRVISGKEFVSANIALHFLTGALFFSFLGSFVGTMILIPAGKESVCLKSSIIAAITNVVLNVFIIPIFGFNGAAFTTMLTEAVGLFVMLPVIDKRVRITDIKNMIKAPLTGCIMIALWCLLIRILFRSAFAVVILGIFGSCICYGIVLKLLKDEFYEEFRKDVFGKLIIKIRGN